MSARRAKLAPDSGAKVVYFSIPAEFRAWLETHHDTAAELWVGYHKRDSGKPSMTWPESVDEALCFGWIDGLRKSVDATRYKIRFTPRRPGSIWSAVNVARVDELQAAGRMTPAGLRAYEKRREDRTRRYAYEQQGRVSANNRNYQGRSGPGKLWLASRSPSPPPPSPAGSSPTRRGCSPKSRRWWGERAPVCVRPRAGSGLSFRAA